MKATCYNCRRWSHERERITVGTVKCWVLDWGDRTTLELLDGWIGGDVEWLMLECFLRAVEYATRRERGNLHRRFLIERTTACFVVDRGEISLTVVASLQLLSHEMSIRELTLIVVVVLFLTLLLLFLHECRAHVC